MGSSLYFNYIIKIRLCLCFSFLLVWQGTKSIKGLTLMSRNNLITLSARTFDKMKKLRFLQLDDVQINGDYGYLSKNLRWLCWIRFPFKSLPTNFNLEKIVAIDLKWSKLVKIWERNQVSSSNQIVLTQSVCAAIYFSFFTNF